MFFFELAIRQKYKNTQLLADYYRYCKIYLIPHVLMVWFEIFMLSRMTVILEKIMNLKLI